MPDDNGKTPPPGGGEIIKPDPIDAELLPPVTPPTTKAPVQFNQQVNVYQQIPQSAWDRLTADQIVELSKTIIQQIDVADKRQFDFAVQQEATSRSGKKIAICCGSVVAVIGFAATAYLAANGHELVALSISLPLATILAIIVGNRFLG